MTDTVSEIEAAVRCDLAVSMMRLCLNYNMGFIMSEMKKLLEVLADVDEDIDFEHEKNLISDGMIDSLLLTRIIVALDQAYDIQIRMGDIEPENFENAKAILELVRQYQKKS